MRLLRNLSVNTMQIHAHVSHVSSTAILSARVHEEQPTDIQHLALVNGDNSQSMDVSGGLQVLNDVYPKFISDMRRDSTIRSSVLMAFGSFGSTEPLKIAAPFTCVDDLSPPQLAITNHSSICSRLIDSCNLLIAGNKLVRRALNVHQRKSWLIEMSDGHATDLEREAEARKAMHETAPQNGIETFFFGVGPNANMDFLNSIAQPGRPAELLDDKKDFAALFAWLKKSLRAVSASGQGQVLEIPSVKGNLIRTQE